MRPAVPRRVRELLPVGAAAVALTAVLMYPISLHPGAFARTDNADGEFGVWNVAWVARTLVVDPRHVFDANIFYPHRWTLAYSESNLATSVLALPGYWLTRSPFVAYNSAVLLMCVLSVMATSALVRRLTGSRGAALVSAIGFAFCPYVMANTAEIQLMMTAGLPLTLLAFHRYADRPAAGRAVVLGSAVALTGLFCGYYGIFVGLAVGWAALVVAQTRRRWRSAGYWSGLALAALVAVAAVLPFFAPYVALKRRYGWTRPLADSRPYSANWQSYLASGAHAHRWMLPWVREWEAVLFPGFLVLALAAVALVSVARERPAPAAAADPPPGGRTETLLLYGSMAALACWLSFGPRAGLYAWMYRLLPLLFSMLRAPNRFGLLVSFGLAVLAGLGAAALEGRAGHPRLVATGLCLLTALDVAAVPVPATPVPAIPSVYAVLRRLPPGPVLELPIFWRHNAWFRNTRYMLYSTAHWKPLVDGYSDFVPPEYGAMAETLSEFPTPESFAILHRLGVRYVMVHPELYYADVSRAALNERLARYRDVLRPAIRGDACLYEIVRWPPDPGLPTRAAASPAAHAAPQPRRGKRGRARSPGLRGGTPAAGRRRPRRA